MTWEEISPGHYHWEVGADTADVWTQGDKYAIEVRWGPYAVWRTLAPVSLRVAKHLAEVVYRNEEAI